MSSAPDLYNARIIIVPRMHWNQSDRKVEFILLTCLKKSLLPILLRVLNFPRILPFGLATIAADESKQKQQ